MNKKRNKLLIITSIIFVVVALIALVVGFTLSGNDVIAWLSSKWAMLIYIVVGCYFLIFIYLVVGDKIRGM